MAEESRPASKGPLTALVLSGAGARGAYEAGVLSVVLPHLVEECDLGIVVGTSAGALNAALVASFLSDGPRRVAEELVRAWSELRPSSVHRRPSGSLAHLAGWHLRHRPATAAALLDTHPLGPTVARLIGSFGRDVGEAGHLRSLAVVASSYGQSRAVAFVQGKPPPPGASDENLEYRPGPLSLDHLLASAAFPIAFAPRWIDDGEPIDGGAGAGGDWYLDGGVHLNTPLKPAIDLGAERVLIVGGTPLHDAHQMSPEVPPDLMDAAGQLVHALAAGDTARDLQALHVVNGSLAPGQRWVEFCSISPADDELSGVCAEIWKSNWWRIPPYLFRYRLLGPLTRQYQRPGQMLSYLCFDPRYLARALQKGRRDGEAVLDRGGDHIPWEA